MFSPPLFTDMRLQAAATQNVAAFRRAILAKDAKWFERTLGPRFVQKVEGRPIDRRTALDQIKRGLLRMKIARLQTRIGHLVPAPGGFGANVAFTGTMHATMQGLPATLTAKWTDDQVWYLDKGHWRLRSLSTHGFEQSIDQN